MSEESTERTDPFADLPLWKVLLIIAFQAIVFIFAGLALFHLSGRPLAHFVTLDWPEAVSGVALALSLILLSMGLTRLFPSYAERIIRSQARTYGFLRRRVSIPAIIFISLCAGVGEEALFRGGLQTVLSDYFAAPLALALAACAFALIHFAQARVSALIFAIGCLFGWIYWQTGSLLTVVIGHSIYDIYALWALQKAMHDLGIFDDAATARLPSAPSRETLTKTKQTKGETL